MPDALIMMPGVTLADCAVHGYRPIVRTYSLREALGIQDTLPDIPPFLSVSPHDRKGVKLWESRLIRWLIFRLAGVSSVTRTPVSG